MKICHKKYGKLHTNCMQLNHMYVHTYICKHKGKSNMPHNWFGHKNGEQQIKHYKPCLFSGHYIQKAVLT